MRGPRQERLFWSLLVASLVLNAMYAALASVLVPALVARADESAKETNLALIMAASSVLTIIVHPLAGALSDRTRSRWGRRSPWIVVGAMLSAAVILGLGSAQTVVGVAIGWLLAQPLLNVVEAPLDAVLADRVGVAGRVRASANYGAGAAAGLAVGAVVAGALVDEPQVMVVLLAAALLVTMVAFVRLNPDRSVTERGTSMPWRHAWSSRDFRLVFVACLLLVLGSQMVLGFLLYIIMDFSGADVSEAGRLVPLFVGLHLVCLIVGAITATRWAGVGRVKVVLGASVIIVVGLLIPMALPSLAGLAIYAAVSGLGRGAYLTADLALMMDVLPSGADHGRDLGALGLATILPQSLAPALGGVLLAVTANDYRCLFVVAALFVLASMPVVARIRSDRTLGLAPTVE